MKQLTDRLVTFNHRSGVGQGKFTGQRPTSWPLSLPPKQTWYIMITSLLLVLAYSESY